MNPRNSTASFSHREQRRRNPFKRRNTRSIAVRRFAPHGPTPKAPPGGAAAAPRATARCQGLAPSSARAKSSARLSGGGSRRVSPWRPAGAVGAGAGESAKARAVRASAATRRLLGGPAPRDRPREGGGFVNAPVPAGGTWTRGRASDRLSRLRRPLGARCRGAHRARTPGGDPRGSRGARGGGEGPNRAGHPRQLPPCAATDKRAVCPGRGGRRTGPRGTGRGGALRAYRACVRSIRPGTP